MVFVRNYSYEIRRKQITVVVAFGESRSAYEAYITYVLALINGAVCSLALYEPVG